MNCSEALRTQCWLDGELQGEAAREAELHVATCLDCQQLATETAGLSDALRGVVRYRAPAALRIRIGQSLDKEAKRLPRGFWTGVITGVAGSALAAAVAVFAVLPFVSGSLAAAVVEAHGRALREDRAIMVASSEHHTVKPWLAAHAAISPPVTDFAAQGFVLAGGRTDIVAGRTAAVTVYRYGAHEIDVFTWPDRGGNLPQPGLIRGFRTSFWKAGDLDFAAVSDMDATAFGRFVALVQQQ